MIFNVIGLLEKVKSRYPNVMGILLDEESEVKEVAFCIGEGKAREEILRVLVWLDWSEYYAAEKIMYLSYTWFGGEGGNDVREYKYWEDLERAIFRMLEQELSVKDVISREQALEISERTLLEAEAERSGIAAASQPAFIRNEVITHRGPGEHHTLYGLTKEGDVWVRHGTFRGSDGFGSARTMLWTAWELLGAGEYELKFRV